MELKNKLVNFMETSAYQQMLERQIRHAKEVAGEEALVVYLDPGDEDKLQRIALHMGSGADIRLSQYSFGGGMRGGDPLQKHFDRQLLRLPHPGGEAPRIIPSDRKRRTGP